MVTKAAQTIKLHSRVKFTRRNGERVEGVLKSKIKHESTGLDAWFAVLVDGETRKVDGKLRLSKIRPSEATAV